MSEAKNTAEEISAAKYSMSAFMRGVGYIITLWIIANKLDGDFPNLRWISLFYWWLGSTVIFSLLGVIFVESVYNYNNKS